MASGVRTRSFKGDVTADDKPNNEYVKDDIGSILQPLREKLSEVFTLISNIEKRFDERFARHELLLNNLQTRINYLESRSEYSIHLAKLNKRKIDDSEQHSKKINLIIYGIPVEKNENPRNLLEKIKAHISEFDLGINDSSYDLCHRIGRKKTVNFTKRYNSVNLEKQGVPDISVHTAVHQNIVLKMSSRCERNRIYENRKMFTKFKVFLQLTDRRRDILSFAQDEIKKNDYAKVDFVYADFNCKLKVRTKTGRFHGFNSTDEFLTLLSWLHHDETFLKFDAFSGKSPF